MHIIRGQQNMSSRLSTLARGTALLAIVSAAPALAQMRDFDIPAQPAVRSIPELARQGEVQILAPAEELQGLTTPAVKGRMDVRAALQQLIAATSLRIDSDNGRTITLRSAERPTGTGSLRGRVLNGVTGAYIANAEIQLEGRPIAAYSEGDGSFRLSGIPAGEATVRVRYTGLEDSVATVTITDGAVATLDIAMNVPSGGENATAITVTARREGQAAALMERKVAINAKTVVTADNYGLQTMGDVGEFLKSMPGISLDYTEVDATAVRIGGLDPKYSTFTTDGFRMATATSNNNNGRQNSFEQMSITGIAAIELNNTLTASMDADAPGGNINLRSKYAFQRGGREISFQIGGVGTSDAGFSSVYFPDDRKHARIYPSAQVNYADVFFDNRLGIALNGSYNANYVQQDRVQTDWSYLPDGTAIPYRVMWRPGPKRTHRIAGNAAIDYRVTDDITFSLRGNYSFYDVEYFNQYTYLIFGTTTKSYATPDSTGTHIVVNPNGTNTRLHTQYSHRYAGTPAWMVAPKLEYKGDSFEATLRGSYSSSAFNFRDTSKGFFQRTDSWLTGIGFTLDRASEDSSAWTLNQTAGRPWGDPASFNRDAEIGYNVRTAESQAKNEMYGVNADFRKELALGDASLTLMAGGGARRNDWRTNEGSYQQYKYVGPDGSQTSPGAVIPWTQDYQFAIHGMDAGNMNDQNWRADSNYATYDIFRDHPEWFIADSFGNLKRQLDNDKRVKEDIYAGYLEAQSQWGRAKFDLGVRYERTRTSARVADVRPVADVIAAGLSPTSTEGLLYQYNYGRTTTRKGNYGDWFLSGGVKYDITDDLVAQIAFSQAILRPDYGNLGGVVSVNDDTMIVSVPNINLKPERSIKYFASLQYYLEPSGIVGVSVYKLDIKDMQVTGITVDPEDVGYDPSAYEGYTFRSAQNAPGTSTNIGVTLEYDQQLTFLPGVLKGFGLRGSATFIDPDGERVNMPKQSANWGIRYSRGGFDIQLMGNWQSKYRTSALSNTETTANNGILYHADRQLWNLSASYRISRNFDLMLAGRNIFNAPDVIYSNIPGRVQQYSIYGSMWNFGIKGKF